jgi:PAS domain S-box-containing protein
MKVTQAQRHAAVWATINDAVVAIDPDGRIVLLNPAAEKLLGCSEADAMGSPVSRFCPEDRHAQQAEVTRRVLETGSVLDVEDECLTADGRRVPVEITLSRHDDEQGRHIGVTAVLRDITERKRAAERLRESEERFRAAFDSAQDCVLIWDRDYNYLYANQAAIDHAGTTLDKAVGRNIRDGLGHVPDFMHLWMSRIDHVLATGERLRVQDQTEMQGRVYHTDSIITPIRDADGTVTSVCCVHRDLTELKQVEEAMERRLVALTQPLDDANEVAFEDLFNLGDIQRLQDEFSNATGVASIITQVDGTPITKPSNFCRLCNGIIRETEKGRANCYKSDAALGHVDRHGPTIQPCMSGGLWDAGAAISVGGKHIANWLIGQVRDDTQTEEKMREYAREIGADEGAVVEAFRDVPAMSREQFGRIAQVLFTLANQLSTTAYQNVQQARFITERKRAGEEKRKLEEQYHRAQKVESIGRLAGGVAHDLNNLLSPILGYGEMLLDDLGPEDERRESVDEILRAGFRARDLVRQLLAFSRKQTLEYRPVDMGEAVRRFERLLRRAIREDIEIRIIPSPSIPTVMADIGQMEQVIMNLAVNAGAAMPEGGVLTIETAPVRLDDDYADAHQDVQPGTYVMLAVSDTGRGMDEETREHAFEPFFSTKGEQGTGLGLATVHGIVKQHGGNIWLHSEAGKGTTFKIYLPVSGQTPAEGGPPGRRAAVGPEGNETVLLAEDEEQVRHLARAILKQQGYTVLVAESGSDALAILDQHDGPVHLLLTDVIMPGLNGKELFLQATDRLPDLKVLYMSGYTGNVLAHHGMQDEDPPFIQKPFAVRALTAKVREVLDQG